MRNPFVLFLLAAAAVPVLALAAQAAPAGAPARFDADANHDGYLSRAEAQSLADARFKRLDANGDGKLTRDELAAHRRWARADGGPEQPGPPSAGAPSPLAPSPLAPSPGSPPAAGAPPPAGAWGMDAGARRHGPGGERIMAHRFMRARAGMVDILFDEYDANHDGAIEIGEFRAHALKMFDAMDGNRDGKIKLPERGAFDRDEDGKGPGGPWRAPQGPPMAPPEPGAPPAPGAPPKG